MSTWTGQRRRRLDAAQPGGRRGRAADHRRLRRRRSGARARRFEEVAYLLLNGRLPEPAERAAFARDLAARRELPRAAIELLREAAAANDAADGRAAHGRAAAQPRPARRIRSRTR